MSKSFWDEPSDEEKNFKLGSSYPPVRVYISAIDLARINTQEPVYISAILSDGKEIDIELMLEVDRDVFAKDLKGLLDETKKDSS